MALIKWTPFEELDRFFEDEFVPMIPTMKMREFRPEVDIYQDKDNVVVEMPLAGVDPKKIDISVEDNVLTVKGSMDEKKEVKEKDFYRKEIRRGTFERSLTLPVKVKGEKAQADFEGGMLKIVLPKKVAVKKKKVTVKVKNKKTK